MTPIPLYIIFSLTAAVFFSISSVLNKFASKHTIDNKNSMMAYFMILSFIFALFLLPFVGSLAIPSQAIMPFLINAITFIIGYYLFYVAVFDTDASSYAPLLQLQAAFIAILAYLFLGERFPIANYAWIALILFGAVLVSLDEKMHIKSFLQKGIMIIVVMQIFHAASNLFVGITLHYLGPIQILFWEYVTLGIACIPFVLITKPKLNYNFKAVAPLALATWTSATGAVFLFQAFKTNLTIPSTIALLTSPIVLIISVIMSRFRPELLEHHTTKVYAVRTAGVVLILIAALMLSQG